jgi:hypothetical protein
MKIVHFSYKILFLDLLYNLLKEKLNKKLKRTLGPSPAKPNGHLGLLMAKNPINSHPYPNIITLISISHPPQNIRRELNPTHPIILLTPNQPVIGWKPCGFNLLSYIKPTAYTYTDTQ